MTTAETANAILSVDLDAVGHNWRTLRETFTGSEMAAVVKANGYGLGADRIGPALTRAGCQTFFVATVDEGTHLRAALPEATIHVLNGLAPNAADVFAAHNLVPVLNDLGQIKVWQAFCRTHGKALPADLHVDTGMNRLGLTPGEVDILAAEPDRLDGIALGLIMSHLASADEPESPQNAEQLRRFAAVRTCLPPAPVSFANSSGLFLGPDYHFDLGRPGVALYGVNPVPGHPNPMRATVRLSAKILQIRDVDALETVGYGATHRVTGKGRIATLGVGYADGYPRSLSNTGAAHIGKTRVPIVGRVSMDLITLDITGAPESEAHVGACVDLIGPEQSVDDVAEKAGTIGYEILTGLGARYHRVYLGGDPRP